MVFGRLPAALVVSTALFDSSLEAQTDYYNTDVGRPIRVQDAYAIEHRGLELQATPVRLERGRGGQYRWGFEPAIEYGVLPRTQIEVAFPLAWIDASPSTRRSGLAGIDLSVLHNLNVETQLPALAVGAGVLLPVGSLSATRAYPSIIGIATRTFSQARLHVNAQYTFGNAPPVTANASTALVGGQVIELSPRWAIDGGIGRQLTGSDQAWSLTFGGAYAFGLPWRP